MLIVCQSVSLVLPLTTARFVYGLLPDVMSIGGVTSHRSSQTTPHPLSLHQRPAAQQAEAKAVVSWRGQAKDRMVTYGKILTHYGMARMKYPAPDESLDKQQSTTWRSLR